MDNKLYILWTNADVNTAKHMVMMYSTNAKLHSWWEEVTVIIWGATAKLVGENAEVQEKIKTAMEAGVEFSACKACAKELGVVKGIEAQGIEVKYWGEPLTEIIKSGAKLITI